jgi:hypothetical protein
MRFGLLMASMAVAAVVAGGSAAHAFTFENQDGNTSDGTPRFSDPDQAAERMTEPSASTGSGSSRVYFGGSGSPGNRLDDPTYDRSRPLPGGAQIGAGGQGFGNYRGSGSGSRSRY